MSNPAYSLADLKYVEPTTLKSWFETPAKETDDIAVIDVRDDDFVGGHIKGAHNFPSKTFGETLPELHSKVKESDAKDIVIHCKSSKNRGTRTTLEYLNYIESLPEEEKKIYESKNVWVLKGGFDDWQKEFGKDEKITDDYDEKLWKEIAENDAKEAAQAAEKK